jgi:L-lactate dehydrogenase complex protein LldG
MTSREKIFGRIQEALRGKAPLPGHRAEEQPSPVRTDVAGLRHWLPPVGPGWEAQCELFARNSAALKTEFKMVANAAAAGEELQRIAAAGGWKRLAAHRTPLLAEVIAAVNLEVLWTDAGYAVKDLESCEGGVTACEALVAQTGSVLVTTASSGGRALSVLPPHHIVLATREQLVPDLSAAFGLLRRKYDGHFPSMISFITGPSRTGDIERILVLGAHGPRKLTVLCW